MQLAPLHHLLLAWPTLDALNIFCIIYCHVTAIPSAGCPDPNRNPCLRPRSIHNADIHMTDDHDLDDLVDVIEGSRVYVPAIYVINKIDQITIEELEVMDKSVRMRGTALGYLGRLKHVHTQPRCVR